MNFDEIFPDEIILLILDYLPIQDLMNATRLPSIYRLAKDKLWWMNHRTSRQRALALEFAFERGVEWIKEMLLYSCVSVREFEDLFYRPIKDITLAPPIQFYGVSDADDALSLAISEGYWWLIKPLIIRWKANPDYTEYHRWSYSNFWEDALVVEAACQAVEMKEPRILTEMLKCGADPNVRSNGGNAAAGPCVDRKLGCCNSYHHPCDGWDDDGIDERCDPTNNYDDETYKLIKYLRKEVSKSRQKLNSTMMFG